MGVYDDWMYIGGKKWMYEIWIGKSYRDTCENPGKTLPVQFGESFKLDWLIIPKGIGKWSSLCFALIWMGKTKNIIIYHTIPLLYIYIPLLYHNALILGMIPTIFVKVASWKPPAADLIWGLAFTTQRNDCRLDRGLLETIIFSVAAWPPQNTYWGTACWHKPPWNGLKQPKDAQSMHNHYPIHYTWNKLRAPFSSQHV